jgi:ribonucleoside-diphosphate reductase alpha chain
MRERLPDTRKSITHKLVLTHHTYFYITVGLYDDGRPAELFITTNKGNDAISGFCKVFGFLVSLALQGGVEFEKLHEKLAFQDFEPKGFTRSADIHSCTSVVDYVVRWMKFEFGRRELLKETEKHNGTNNANTRNSG